MMVQTSLGEVWPLDNLDERGKFAMSFMDVVGNADCGNAGRALDLTAGKRACEAWLFSEES